MIVKIKNSFQRLLSGFCLAILFLFPFSVFANEIPSDFSAELDNPTSPALLLKGQHSYYDAPLLETDVDIAVTGMITNVKVTQSFENQSTEWVEGKYVFPLPDQAAVNSLIVRIGSHLQQPDTAAHLK